MEGYEIYRLSDDEIRHFGVKGMKWGKRKSRSAYMRAVDKHEAKTKANREKVAAHKAREKEQGKAVAKAIGAKYMYASRAHEAKTTAKRDAKKAASKAKYEQEKEDLKNVKNALKRSGKNYIEKNKAKEVVRLEKRIETKAKREVKGAARKQLAKDIIENYKKSLVKSLDDPMVKALVASSIYANNSYSMDSTRTGANAHRQMFY